MYSQKTIDEINNLDLVDVIGKYVDLKKAGANYKGKSPFSDEKTGSFIVSPGKNMWKCFSSGIGGNSPVKFIMLKDKKTWKEAINELAGKYNITIEYDDERGEKILNQFAKMGEIREVNLLALEWFQLQLLNDSEFKKLPEAVINQASRASMEQIESFQIGFAPDDFKGLYSHLLTKGVPIELMVQSGLITEKKDEKGTRHFDFFRNRIMFPIYANNGSLVGFTGRAIEWKKGDPLPKVMNSRENDLFSKSENLLGINLAKQDMITSKTAIKVEGNFDVTAFHQKGLVNTVAALGTAFTEAHAQLLKRFAQKVILAIDNDDAAIKKVEADVRKLITAGVAVDVWFPDQQGQDPFDYVNARKELDNETFRDDFYKRCQDGIEYVAEYLFRDAESVREKASAQEQLVDLLAIIPNATLRKNYIKLFIEKYKITQKEVEEKVSVEIAAKKAKELEKSEAGGYKLPSYLTVDQVECFNEYMFFADTKVDRVGYYFMEGKYPEKQSNVVIRPIFQAKEYNQSKFIVELTFAKKGDIQTSIMEWTNEAFVSQQKMEIYLSNDQCWFQGTKKQYQYLTRKLFTQFPVCSEIKILGWHNDGFFAFANGISDGTCFKEINSYGICVHGDRNYYLPAFSKIYTSLNSSDDTYEEDRKLIYRASNATFNEWATLFNEVYHEKGNGMIGISTILAGLFSDHIYSVNNSFPMLHGYGVPKTGKSTMGRSMSALFKAVTTPVNLNNMTSVSIISLLQNVKNVMVHLDEYRNDLKPEYIEVLKGVWDRMGRARGSIKDDKTKQTKIHAFVYVSGQPLPTANQNAYFTRSILLRFEIKDDDRTIEEKKLYKKLSKMEKAGLSHIILEVLKYRDYVVENFEEAQFQLYNDIKGELEGRDIDGRVQSNVLACATVVKLLGDKLLLPFSFEKYWIKAKDVIIDQSETITETDELMEFFKILEYMYAERRISEGFDFKIETKELLVIRGKARETHSVDLGGMTKIIHFSFTRIHPIYSKIRKEVFGLQGQTESELRDIMKMHKAFIGTPPVVNFNGKQSSGYSFRMDLLPIDLEYKQSTESSGPSEPMTQNSIHGMTPAMEKEGFPKNGDDLPF